MLKPLSSAISIGSGGPFGAEGPIIMTGGAIGSLFAQRFHLSAAERKTLLVAGAAAGMTGDVRHARRRGPAGGRAAAVRMEAAQLRAGASRRVPWRCAWRPLLIGAGPLFPRRAALTPAGWPIGRCRRRRHRRRACWRRCSRRVLYRIEDVLPPPADPLDVVAGDRRPRRRHRRADRAARARRRL